MAETLTDKNWDEHYIRRGNPVEPTYYIISHKSESAGLFYRFIHVAGHIRHALFNGWLPVVDMQNYPNPYLPPEKLGKENSWEYYFEQPLRIGLEQAYNGANVILSNANEILPRPTWAMPFYENNNNICTEWRMLIKLGLLKIKPAIMQEIATVREKLFNPNDRVLGVLLRGTDYVAKKLKWHPIPPPVEFALSTVVAKLKEWNCNKIFLATEDKSIVKAFKNVFRNTCIILDREYVDYKVPGQAVGLVRIDRPNDHFIQGKDYLTQMVLLSTCNDFVAARCSGSVAVMLLEKSFEHTYFFNLGRYGVITLD